MRARFLLDFSYATGLRAGELVGLRLKQVSCEHGAWWIDVVGKGSKHGRVAVPPMALGALKGYLDLRSLPLEPRRWTAHMPLVATLKEEAGISSGCGR